MKKIVKMVFGSHMYGLNTPDSDMDYKGIYLPELDDLLLGRYKKHINFSTGNDRSKNTSDDIDEEWFSLDEFINLAVKGETIALDMLHVNPNLVTVEIDPNFGHIWNDLVANRNKFYTKNLKAYMGYVKRQAAKYGIKGSRIAAMREAIAFLETVSNHKIPLFEVWNDLPESEFAKRTVSEGPNNTLRRFYEVNGKKYRDTVTIEYILGRIRKALDAYGSRALLAEQNKGIDWKAVHHALRAGYQMLEIYKNGSFSYPLSQTKFLLDVKLGKLDYKRQVAPELERLIEEIEKLHKTVNFPESADREYWDQWLLKVYKEELLK